MGSAQMESGEESAREWGGVKGEQSTRIVENLQLKLNGLGSATGSREDAKAKLLHRGGGGREGQLLPTDTTTGK